jgi:hypothetical protein
MVSLQKCVNRSFGCNSVNAVVGGLDYRSLRKPFAMKVAMKSIEGRPSAGGRAECECVYCYSSRTVPIYVLSSWAIPNYDKRVGCKQTCFSGGWDVHTGHPHIDLLHLVIAASSILGLKRVISTLSQLAFLSLHFLRLQR